MIKHLLALAAVSSLSASMTMPARAQDLPPSASQAERPDIREQLQRLESRIDQARARGELSQAEADRARLDISGIRADARADRDGLERSQTDPVSVDLQARVDRLRNFLRRDRAVATEPTAWTLDRREQWMGERIQRASEAGRLSGDENQHGRFELDAIRAERARLTARDGGAVSEVDRLYLARRIDELNNTLLWQGENPPAPWQGQ